MLLKRKVVNQQVAGDREGGTGGQFYQEDFAHLGLRFPAKPYRDLAALFTRLVGREAKS
jgi:hypothetical protein